MIADVLHAFAAFPPETLAAFVLAGVVLNLTPGADVLFATANGLAGGPRAGALAGLGVGLGGVWHLALAAGGVAAAMAAYPGALTALRWGGAGYLAWLAWASWHAPLPAAPGAAVARPAGARIWRGFLVNALNPKVALFVLAFLPQFTDPARGPVAAQIVALGAIFTLTGTAITCAYGALAGLAGTALLPRLGALNRVAAVVFAGLALRLVWAGEK